MGGKDLLKSQVLSSEWNTERVREDASGDSEDGEDDDELPWVIGERAWDCDIWSRHGRSEISCSTDQSRLKELIVQPTLDGRFVLVPEVKVGVRQARSSLQPALQQPQHCSQMVYHGLYIHLYSPTSGSKEKKTCKHINTVKRHKKTKEKNSEQV